MYGGYHCGLAECDGMMVVIMWARVEDAAPSAGDHVLTFPQPQVHSMRSETGGIRI